MPLVALPINNNGPIGWASVNANGQNGTTGGAAGGVATVNNMNDLIYYCGLSVPYIIQVQGMILITPKGRHIAVSSDKSVIGLGAGAGLTQGGFSVGNDKKNIIFKNLTIADTYVAGDWPGITQDWDGIQIKGTCSHIWVDHCTFLRQGDGALDISNGANYITVSYSKFGANNKVCLIGSSDTDPFTDRYKVTMHHNWFEETTQRHPRVRFGMVHLFNNYYYDMGNYGRVMGYAISNGYGIGIGVNAQIYSEQNYFEKVVYPSQFYDNTSQPGYMIDIGSHLVQSGNVLSSPGGINWNPANYYQYTPDPASQVKAIVLANAGAQQNNTFIPGNLPLESRLLMSNHPNPFSFCTTISINLPRQGHINLKLTDPSGKAVHEIQNKNGNEGLNTVIMKRDGLKQGVYFIILEFQGHKQIHKVVIN